MRKTPEHSPAAMAEQNALKALLARAEAPDATLAYGTGVDHVIDIFVPPTTPHSLVIFLHGGFWRQAVDRTHASPLARCLSERGHLVLLPEYRRVGGGGGFPATLEDITQLSARLPELLAHVSEIDTLAFTPNLPVTVAGHSAGGHLALWWGVSALGGEVGAVARIRALAPVADLTRGAVERIGDGAVVDFMGGTPNELPEAYAYADPAIRWTEVPHPLRGTMRALHGDQDARVPVEHTVQSPMETVTLPGAHHFDVIDPDSTHKHALMWFLEN